MRLVITFTAGLSACSVSLDGDGLTISDKPKGGECEEYSCTPTGWLTDTSHNTSYTFLSYCWACQDNPVDNPFQLDLGKAGVPDDWKQYFPGHPAEGDIYDLIEPAGDEWESSGGDFLIRQETGRLSGSYGIKDGSSSVWPKDGYDSGGTYSSDSLMGTDCHSPGKSGPIECDIVAFTKYINSLGSPAPIDWTYAASAPGKGDFSFSMALRHEFGHVLGIGDKDITDSVMFNSLGAGELRGPSADDIEAAIWLYGVASTECP